MLKNDYLVVKIGVDTPENELIADLVAGAPFLEGLVIPGVLPAKTAFSACVAEA